MAEDRFQDTSTDQFQSTDDDQFVTSSGAGTGGYASASGTAGWR